MSAKQPDALTPAALAHARHELRTPVNAILGYSEMLLEDFADTPAAPGLECLLGLGKRLQAAIAETLDDRRLQGGPLDADAMAQEARRALIAPTQQVMQTAAGLLKDCQPAPLQALLPDVEKIHLAGTRLLALLDDPFGHGPAATPAEAPRLAQQATEDESLPRSDEEFCAGRHGHVLVVDDNAANREILARGLHRQNHYFSLASNGRQALELLATGVFDLVLLDIMMPELDGFAVLARLKADDQLKHVPVIMISALDQIDSVVRCIEMGAEDYLPKPFNPVLLRARVGACLEKKRLRDLELAYLRDVAVATDVAAGVESGSFRPEALDSVAQRTDSLGQLARVFQSMVREVQAREERLKQEVRKLRVEIDEGRKARQVAEITETDYFQQLQERVRNLKGRQRPARE